MIAACVLVYGLGAKPLVKLLALDDGQQQDVLLLGNNALSRCIAEGLGKAGLSAVIVGSDRREVLQARKQGFTAEFGQIQSTALMDRLELERFGAMIALCSSDAANTLGCVHFRRYLGEDSVSQVPFAAVDPASIHPASHSASQPSSQSASQADSEHSLRGMPFGAGLSHRQLLQLAETGEVKLTALTDEFTFEDYLAHHGNAVAPLLALVKGQPPRVVTPEMPPKAGEQLLSIVKG